MTRVERELLRDVSETCVALRAAELAARDTEHPGPPANATRPANRSEQSGAVLVSCAQYTEDCARGAALWRCYTERHGYRTADSPRLTSGAGIRWRERSVEANCSEPKTLSGTMV